MHIGITTFPTDYSISATRLARAAEERGFDSLWVTEHTHIPASRRTPYPWGGDLPSIYWESYEPFTFLAQAAAVTESLKVGTAICLVAEHHPIALAKRAASLDSLSGGRFLFGVGAGWNAEELENHGVAFNDRWKVLREHVLAMKACWTEKAGEYHGDFVDFDPVWVEPKPKSEPLPIYLGAESKWSFDRIAEYADGWLPTDLPGLGGMISKLKDACDARGRDITEIDISPMGVVESQEQLAELKTMGVNRLVLGLSTLDESGSLHELDQQAQIIEWARTL
jgi:probable F420-dependent oxidoreductase